MKSKNLTISNQLAIGFGAVVLIMLVIGGISLHSQSEMNTAREISEHTFKVLATGETILGELDGLVARVVGGAGSAGNDEPGRAACP